jgi:hypothetical protein
MMTGESLSASRKKRVERSDLYVSTALRGRTLIAAWGE